MGNPRISIITVTYNAALVLEETILSVINQTYSNIEYIAIDGGSTDGTVDIIKKYQDKISYWVSEPDRGIYDAMNKGIDKATGEWVNFMNAGDSFSDNYVLKNVFENDNMKLNTADIIYGSVNYKNGMHITELKPQALKKINNRIPFCHQATFVKKDIMPQFNINYSVCADYDAFYGLYKNGYTFKEIPFNIAFYNDNGFSKQNIFRYMKENFFIRKKYGRITYALYIYMKDMSLYMLTNCKLKK